MSAANTKGYMAKQGPQFGSQYHIVNNTIISNYRDKTIGMRTKPGKLVDMTFQVTKVDKPLATVCNICDARNTVAFAAKGGVIHNLVTGSETVFQRENGLYKLDFDLLSPPDINNNNNNNGAN